MRNRHIDDLDDAELTMLVGQDLPAVLAHRVDRHPDKTFLVWEPFEGDPGTWSYGELHAVVERLAGGLYARGVRLGDKVLLHMDNRPEFLFTWFACARLGAVVVSTNTKSVARDMEYYAEKAGFTCALTEPKFVDMIAASAQGLEFIAVTPDNADGTADRPTSEGTVPFASLLEEPGEAPERTNDPRVDLGIQFTSGTTSRPKAVLWTHANAVWAARQNVANFRLEQDDVGLVFLPMFHTNAQSYSMLSTLYVGATLVMQPRFSSSRFWDVSMRNACTWSSVIPFALKAIMGQPVPQHRYRFWVFGVELQLLIDTFGVPGYGLWGMTETVTQGTMGDRAVPGPDLNVGRANPAFDLKVVRDDGTRTDPGETGHLYIRGIRGVQLFKEYFGDPEVTASCFDEDGWFDTGDLVAVDAAGYFYFKDRDKDMLKVGAENVAASEVETVITATGLVAECAVVGQKHYMLDEVPVAFVIPTEPETPDIEDKIIAACRENLPDFKVVRAVHVVDELPRSTLEKIAKAELRARLPEIAE